MLKKTIQYVDFNNDLVTEDHFFHLSKADLVELEMSEKGGLAAMIEKIIASGDASAIISEFKKLLLKAYGQKSEDGKRFIKTQALRDEFQSSEAFSTLFMELVTDGVAASEFINGVVPQGLAEDMAKIASRQKKDPGEPNLRTGEDMLEENIKLEQAKTEALPPKQRVLTRAEVIAMDHEELSHLLATGKAVIAP